MIYPNTAIAVFGSLNIPFGSVLAACDHSWIFILKEIEFSDDFVRIITDHHQFDLDLRRIDKEDIEQAKTFLKKMNFDNRFEIRIVK